MVSVSSASSCSCSAMMISASEQFFVTFRRGTRKTKSNGNSENICKKKKLKMLLVNDEYSSQMKTIISS